MEYRPWILLSGGRLIAAPLLHGYTGTEAANIDDVGIGVVMA